MGQKTLQLNIPRCHPTPTYKENIISVALIYSQVASDRASMHSGLKVLYIISSDKNPLYQDTDPSRNSVRKQNISMSCC